MLNSLTRFRKRAMSLIEVLVVVTILSVLVGGVLVSSRLIGDARKVSRARIQLNLISQAIEKYAEFWPAWRLFDPSVNQFRPIADKGWPDFIASRQFPSPPYSTVTNFNDGPPSIIVPLQEWNVASINRDLLASNACLVYALTAKTGKGPFFDTDDANLLDLRTNKGGIAEPLFPSLGSGAAESRKLVMDPWGTPIRYFWVYRDATPPAGNRAHFGYLPVDYGPFHVGAGAGNINDPAFYQPTGEAKVAVGYVLESAGPNRKFGNLWKFNPTAAEQDDASDNLILKP